jgi:hypothetical protein
VRYRLVGRSGKGTGSEQAVSDGTTGGAACRFRRDGTGSSAGTCHRVGARSDACTRRSSCRRTRSGAGTGSGTRCSRRDWINRARRREIGGLGANARGAASATASARAETFG